jgi:hypothetical protein
MSLGTSSLIIPYSDKSHTSWDNAELTCAAIPLSGRPAGSCGMNLQAGAARTLRRFKSSAMLRRESVPGAGQTQGRLFKKEGFSSGAANIAWAAA